MTERYGDFVLYKPPFNAATIMLWVGPFLLMLLGLFFLIRQIKQRRQDLLAESFSPEDIERARQLLDRKAGNKS
jgi:cytochrome c-type biogenesis protein CcmH